MNPVELQNNEFLRQFETHINGSLARIEYAEQERKIFLTKIVIPVEVDDTEFEENFIKSVIYLFADIFSTSFCIIFLFPFLREQATTKHWK